MTRQVLLLCGVLSSLLYVGIDILGALSWDGYSYGSQAISEMSAVDAPTRSLLAPLYFGYSILLIGFAMGVRAAAGERRGVRRAGTFLAAVGIVGLVLIFFPMHMRGNATSFTDTMHIALGGTNLLFLFLAIGCAAGSFGRGFRLYSAATIMAMVVFGAWTAFLAPAVPENQPTPYLGIVERLVFGAFLLWIAVLSMTLLRSNVALKPRASIAPRGADTVKTAV